MSGRPRNGDEICKFLRPRLHLKHSGSILRFERDTVPLSPKCDREKLASVTFCASEQCRDSMTPGAHAETITKRYGISYKIAHYIMIYGLQLGRRRGGKSRGGEVIERRKMLLHPPDAQKAAQFMLKTGLLGQFQDLKGEPMRL